MADTLDAPIRHRDHPEPVSASGETSESNGQGLCDACNYAKEAVGWRARPSRGERHTVEITTPSGRLYGSTAPPAPRCRPDLRYPRHLVARSCRERACKMSTMEVRSVGRAAVLVEVPDSHDAVSLAAWARERALAREVVPGVRSVLLDGLADRDGLADALTDWSPDATEPGRVVEIPVTYAGPDLDDVAEAWGCEVDEVVARHESTEFVSAFCGFAPGFAYLAGLPDELPEVPRLATPRTHVPAGSVALAGRWCGIYPTASPGGWRVIGHTDATLFDVRREPPALLAPGTRVRFVTS